MNNEASSTDPAQLPPERMKAYKAYMRVLRENGNREIADAIDRVLFAPFTYR